MVTRKVKRMQQQKVVKHMFDRILIITDLSAAAVAVAKNLDGLKALGVRECLLLVSLNLNRTNTIAMTYSLNEIDEKLQVQRQLLENQGFIVETKMVPVLSNKDLCQIASDEASDLILVGAQATSDATEIFFGGIAYEIIHHSCKPVLIVRLAETSIGGTSNIEVVRSKLDKNILFPTDFSETADKAFEVLRKLVRSGAKKVILMHVQEQSQFNPDEVDKLIEHIKTETELLTAMKATLQKDADVEVEIVVKYGDPKKEILNVINMHQIRLVVMGNEKNGFVKELFVGSLSHNIAREAKSSVLLIPANR